MSSAATEPRIRVLPPQVANQIAAGEVVERPASVVKELLENSLDAGARTIEVEIEQGGVQRIRIRDDGRGIHHDDLELALSPHATSKIVTADDLDGVISLGFRGEALASIASVSRLLLASRRAGEESGWRIAANEMAITPAPLPPGTEIEVCDLFYNTPARRKFLRSERTEFSHVEEVIRRIALSRFDLALRFNHNGKQILRLKPSLPEREGIRRVAEVLGSVFAENSIGVDVSAGGLRLWGWIGRDGYSRSQADVHYFYLNGRMIRDRLAGHAARLAFGERIPEGRFPAYLLYLEIDPRLVDVNVHPTKHEVRFREARQVHDFIYWAINGALGENSAVLNEADTTSAARHEPEPRKAESYRTPLRTAVREAATHYTARTSPSAPRTNESDGLLGRAVCLLRNGYLLAERSDVTILVDLRALLAELHYRHLTTPGGETLLTSQPLLIPESLNLDIDAARLWRERGGALQLYGFEFGWLGDTLLVLRKVPAIVRAASIPSLLMALQTWLGQPGDNEESARNELLQMLSSHAVPQQLPAYSLSELNTMLREYEAAPLLAGERPWREFAAADWQRLFELFS
jgi:DNA mismatch repair protein MutL